MTNAGRVLLIPRGDYNAATTYTMLDVVYYEGRSYVCKQTSTGNLPTNTTYWQAMTEADADKMNVTNPTGTGSFSLNRKANTTVGNHSFAEGINCTASGNTSHAEGEETTASGGQGAHAEGTSSTASGNMSHAEGNTTTASGTAAHSEGMVTQAIGKYTHAGGYYNQANYDYQTVIGKNNSNKTTTLFEVGNGSSYASADRSNAFEVYSDGSLSTDNGTTKVKLEDLVSENQALTNYVAENNVKNLFNIYGEKASQNVTSATIESNGFRLVQSTAETFKNLQMWLRGLKKNTDYVFYTNCTITSGHPLVLIDNSSGTTVGRLNPPTAGENVLNFNTGNDTDFKFYFYCVTGTSETGEVLYADIMVCEKAVYDAGTAYQPYAKTNVELTQESAGANYTDQSLFTNIDDTAIARPHFEVYKRGNAIYGVFTFDIIRTVTNGEVLFKTPVAPKTDTFFNGTGVGTSDIVKGFVWKNNGNVCSYGSNTAEDYIGSNVSTFIS